MPGGTWGASTSSPTRCIRPTSRGPPHVPALRASGQGVHRAPAPYRRGPSRALRLPAAAHAALVPAGVRGVRMPGDADPRGAPGAGHAGPLVGDRRGPRQAAGLRTGLHDPIRGIHRRGPGDRAVRRPAALGGTRGPQVARRAAHRCSTRVLQRGKRRRHRPGRPGRDAQPRPAPRGKALARGPDAGFLRLAGAMMTGEHITAILADALAAADEHRWDRLRDFAVGLPDDRDPAVLLLASEETVPGPLAGWLGSVDPSVPVLTESLEALTSNPAIALRANRVIVPLRCGELLTPEAVESGAL